LKNETQNFHKHDVLISCIFISKFSILKIFYDWLKLFKNYCKKKVF